MKLFEKAKEAAEQAATKAKERVEDAQTKRELHAAYQDLGIKAYGLIEAGELERPEFTSIVEKIRELEVKLAESEAAEEPVAETPVEPAAETPPVEPEAQQPPPAPEA